LLDGLFGASAVQPYFKKYSTSPLTQITSTSTAIPHPQEGRIAIVTDVGCGDAVALQDERRFFADGEVVWS